MNERMDSYTLSPMQAGMLYHSVLEPGSGVYVKQFTSEITGDLNISALGGALQKVVDRHSILRTFFLWEDLQKPVQVVQSAVKATIHREDWTGLPATDAELRLRSYLEADRTRGFDLSKPPLMRLALIQMAADAYILVWTWHHILIDGWSEGLLARELFARYQANCAGKALRLPRPKPFREYINWLQRQDLSKAEAFWRRNLKGFTKPVTLGRPLSPEEESAPAPAYERNRVLISKESTAALQEFARRHRLTLNTLVQGAWGVILSRYSGRRDVVFGVVVSGRPAQLEGVESMLGLFVNTLPARIDVDPGARLLPWLDQLQARQSELLRWDYSALSDIQKWSDMPRGVSLFESITSFDMSSMETSMPGQIDGQAGVKVERSYSVLQISNPISILIQTGPQLFLGISYDGRRFDSEFIKRLLLDFESLLASFVAAPEQALSDLLAGGEKEAEAARPLDELSELCERSNLTRNQVMIWLSQKLNPDIPLYNNPYIIRLKGTIEPVHFINAARTLVNSSDALRTVIEERDGVPHQMALPDFNWDMEQIDFSRHADPEAAVRAWLRDRCRAPFCLERRLFDCALIKVSEREFIIYFDSHQLISDARSAEVIGLKLLSLYEISAAGELKDKVQMAQFSEYLEYERGYRRSLRYQETAGFWQRTLSEAAEPMTFYGKSSVKKTLNVEKITFAFGRERSRRLRESAGASEVFMLSDELTIFTIFAGLSSAFLYRVAGARNIPLGVYYHNRRRFPDTIGLFMHVHPLRVTVEDGDTFLSLIKRAQSEYLKVLRYRDYTVANPSHKPAYDVLINYVKISGPEKLNGATVSYEWLHSGHGSESLAIEFLNFTSGNYEAAFRFHEDVFGERRRAEAIRHFLQLIDSYLDDNSQRIAQARLLTEEERERLLVEFNRTNREYQPYPTVIAHFENQVEQTPDRVAIIFREHAVTYRELNARSNQLARYLRKLGVGPESVVGLQVGRSPELGIGMLGILKAGAAFVPLDSSYPKARLEFMRADSGAEVLLTQAEFAATMQGLGELICLDSDWQIISAESRAGLSYPASPDTLAYVIYTSGATGKPKGTMIGHSSLADYNETAGRVYEITARDRVLQFCSLSFDTSIEEIIPCLTHGATLVFRTDEMLDSMATFLQTCRQWEITLLSLPTAFWNELTEGVNTFDLPLPAALRLVIIGGEKVLPEKLTMWQRRAKHATRLIITYGLTESTIISTAEDLTTLTLSDPGSQEVPIGGPISNTQLYLLDHHSEPVPVGIPGELHVGGRLLARGYYRRPELTAERFAPNPFVEEAGARLYKTGDLARFSPDATLEFLGRSDRQIKIRGFRVELDEIARALRQHAGVRDCLVVDREYPPGNKQLLAYVAPRDPSAQANEFREFLGKTLPHYMVPSALVLLESLPISPNGKIDYEALPLPARDHTSTGEAYVAPRTAAEKDLTEIWASVLGLDRVGVRDNYFDIGGDSIRSIQILAKARQRGLQFKIHQLFHHQTIEELAGAISAQPADSFSIHLTDPFSLLSEEDRARMPDGVEDAYPIARLQAGMIFHNLYYKNSDLYIDVSTLHLQFPCDVEVLQAAIDDLIARHPILRTSFDLSGYSEPLQLVWRAAPVRLVVEDLSSLDADAQERILREWIEAETRRQFDLSEAPLIRFHMHRRSATTLQFSWSNHHAILDGWSMATMLTELFQLYNSRSTGKPHELAPMPAVTYRDFVALEKQVLDSDEARRHLSNEVRDLDLTKMPRLRLSGPRQRIPEVRSQSLVPPLETCEQLRLLAGSVGLPMKSFVLAAQLKVLSMVTGECNVTTGLVMSGRPELEGGDRLIGLFTNTLPLRLSLRGGAWMDLARSAFEAERDIVPFRRFPISELKTMEGGRLLFETMFNFTHFYLYKTVPRVSGAQVFDVGIRAASNFVFVTDCNQDFSSSQFELAFSYDASQVGHEEISAISRFYLRTLEAMIDSPYGRYDNRCLLSSSEWEQVVAQPNDTAVDYGPERPVSRLFEARAGGSPDAIALRCGEEQLTYGELNRAANRLAHYLRRAGVGPDVLVGVAAERSVELVVALLAVMKAGGAYAPLDPSYPKTRLEYMLEDCGVSVLLTQSHLLDALPEAVSELICLDRHWPIIASEPADNPQPAVSGDNLAYMIYTSGSTGQPKGALNTHRGLHNRLAWMQEQYGLTADDRVLQKTPFSFDVSVWEFFWPLMTGACLALARPGGHQDSAYLTQLIKEDQITTLHFVPSMLQAFLEEPGVESCRSLRRVISSGEALTYESVERFSERLSEAALHNLYGPTEASIDVTFWACRLDESQSAPIGRPIANTEVYILDGFLHPAPASAPGELYIGGVGVGRGYHRRPELTAERFIPDPFSRTPAARLYRTGDLARYQPDMQIEYLGRCDQQVKIRGFRIEPGEIEAALRQFPGIKDVQVHASEAHGGEKQLIGYLIYDHEPAPETAQLREFLGQRLPPYMSPAAFVALQRWPLTPNGKVDRRALMAIKPDKPVRERAFVAPLDEVEQRLASIWERLFKIHPIGVEDNFIELGGNSILALRLMAQVHREFGLPLPVSTLVEGGTIAHLAGVLRRRRVGDSTSPVVAIQAGGQKPPFFCVHPLGGHVLRYYDLARKLGPDQPFYGIQGRDLAYVGQDYMSIEQMAEVYLDALRRVQPTAPYLIGGYSYGSFVAFEMAQQLVRSGQEVALLVLLDTWAPHAIRLLPEFEKDSHLLAIMAREMALRLGAKDFEVSMSALEELEGDAQLRFFIDQVRGSGLLEEDIPDEVGIPYIRGVMSGIRTRGAAVRNYRPKVYRGKITCLRCMEQDPILTGPMAVAGLDINDPTSGWASLSSQPVEVHFVDGYHERMMFEPTVSEVAGVLTQCIDRSMIQPPAGRGYLARLLNRRPLTRKDDV